MKRKCLIIELLNKLFLNKKTFFMFFILIMLSLIAVLMPCQKVDLQDIELNNINNIKITTLNHIGAYKVKVIFDKNYSDSFISYLLLFCYIIYDTRKHYKQGGDDEENNQYNC